MGRYCLRMVVVVGILMCVGTAHADVCWVTNDNGTKLQDSDCDGIIDKFDSCPKPDQKDVNGNALDTDSDGVTDACDNCKQTPNAMQWNPKDGKQWQPDSDGDGIGDACDNCPKTSNPDQKDANGNGVGDVCECTPDEESNPLTPGPKDVCQSATILLEYGCDKGKQLSFPPIDCSVYSNLQQDSICENGACVFKPKSGGPTTPPPKPECGYYDTDKDGIGDECDNCPFKPNGDQADADGDKIGDACDPKSDTKPKDDKGGSLPGSSGGGGSDGPKCKENPTHSHSDNPLASVTTMNFFAATRITSGSTILDIVAGEGGNVMWRNAAKLVWAKFHNPWDDVPQITFTDVSAYKRDITALWSSGTTVTATTVGGHVFQVIVDTVTPGNSTWKVLGPSGVGDINALGSALYAVHGISPDNFWVAGRNGALWHYAGGKWISAAQEDFLKLVPWLWRMDRARRGDVDLPKRPNVLDFAKFATATWRGVRALEDGQVWVVGDDGKILHRTASSGWQDVSLATKINLRTVWVGANELYIGGADGKIFCNPSSIALCAQLDSAATVLAISGDKADQLIAVGTHGLIATKTGNDPKVWAKQTMAVPNALTAVAGSASGGIIAGINGSVYEFNTGGWVPTMLQRSTVSHPEWTATQWSTMIGTINKKGNITGTVYFSGDDLAIVQLDTADFPWKWELLYSDAEFVPFTSFYSMPHRTIRDMIRVGTFFYAVGNFDFFIKGDLAKSWEQLPFVPKAASSGGLQEMGMYKLPEANGAFEAIGGKAPAPLPDMKTVRQGPAKTILMAGNLGVFQWDPATMTVTDLQKTSVDGAAAMMFKDNSIWALTDGLHGGIVANWAGTPNLVPEDVASFQDTIAVSGQEASAGNAMMGNFVWLPPPPWHYLKYTNGKWQDASSLIPQATGLRRLKGVNATVYIQPKSPLTLSGTAILGDREFVAIATGNGLYQLGYKPTSGDAWWDGEYNYDYSLDIGLTEATASFHVDVVGVGSHNRIHHFVYKYQCTVSYKDVLKDLW